MNLIPFNISALLCYASLYTLHNAWQHQPWETKYNSACYPNRKLGLAGNLAIFVPWSEWTSFFQLRLPALSGRASHSSTLQSKKKGKKCSTVPCILLSQPDWFQRNISFTKKKCVLLSDSPLLLFSSFHRKKFFFFFTGRHILWTWKVWRSCF
jgi:hypothetical protein